MRLLLAAMSLVLVAACGTSDSGGGGSTESPAPTAPTASAASGPAAAVEQPMRALDAGDCDAVKALVVTPSAVDCGDVEAAEGSFADEGTELDDVTYTAGPSQGTTAKVTIDWGNDNPGESYDVENVDGTWLVVFDAVA
ncbi:hypothetical protein [Aeromicrobium sp. UC242_57]|uniref:hypothetical protein n=1 Tax=Aeromicrobium sp. UC242_57 TaxID=3374624 RepID=UPI0037B20087